MVLDELLIDRVEHLRRAVRQIVGPGREVNVVARLELLAGTRGALRDSRSIPEGSSPTLTWRSTMKKKCQRTEIEELAQKIDEKVDSLQGDGAKTNALRQASLAGLSAAAEMLRAAAALQDPCSPKSEQTTSAAATDEKDDE